MRIRSVAVIASLAGALFAAPAFADVTYTWNTETGGSTVTGNSSQYTFTSGGETIKVRAYSLAGLTTSSTFETASIGIHGGGIGVQNSGEDGSQPNHALDNSGRYDFLLIEFENGNFKNFGAEIGWSSNDSDVEVWVGNAAAGLNLTNSGLCSGSCNFEDLDNMGFGPSTDFSNVPLNTTQSVSGSLTGRYLLIAGGRIDSSKDYFKVSLITGKETTTTNVPEPSSLMLLAAAVAGVGAAGRRRHKTA